MANEQREHKKIGSTLIKSLIAGVIFYIVCSNLILWAHHYYHSETKVISDGAKVKR